MPFDYPELEVFWRPPDGRELVYRTARPGEPALLLYSLETGMTTTLVRETSGEVRPRGWSPDGKRFVYHTVDADDRPLKTLFSTWIPGVLSKSTRRPAVSRMTGTGSLATHSSGQSGGSVSRPRMAAGRARRSGARHHESDITHGDALNWSPDDEWIIVYPLDGHKVILIDPDGKRRRRRDPSRRRGLVAADHQAVTAASAQSGAARARSSTAGSSAEALDRGRGLVRIVADPPGSRPTGRGG